MTFLKGVMPVFILMLVLLALPYAGQAKIQLSEAGLEAQDLSKTLTPHKALYDINLVATRSGAQVVNISGKMYYELKSTCDAWVTNHRFNLFYEYADSPSMNITSHFSTFEQFDGQDFSFSARRKRDQNLYEELRGRATIDEAGVGLANFRIPDDLQFDLSQGTLFPMGHTAKLVQEANSGNEFFKVDVFDGSDDEGPVEINAFIGKSVNPMKYIEPSKELDMSMLNNKAWKIRLAVFPTLSEEAASADYEMDMIFHENGVISDMLIDYDNFSVTQKLIALEPVTQEKCENH